MTALPAATTATASSATEGDVKNYLIGLHDFLAGLLGATGVPADARAVLGVTPLTAGNIAAVLGYTPANPANSGNADTLDGYHAAGLPFAPKTAFTGAYRWDDSNNRYIRLTRDNGGYVDVAYHTASDGGGG